MFWFEIAYDFIFYTYTVPVVAFIPVVGPGVSVLSIPCPFESQCCCHLKCCLGWWWGFRLSANARVMTNVRLMTLESAFFWYYSFTIYNHFHSQSPWMDVFIITLAWGRRFDVNCGAEFAVLKGGGTVLLCRNMQYAMCYTRAKQLFEGYILLWMYVLREKGG